MRNRSLKLADLPKGSRYSDISFSSHVEGGCGLENPIISRVFSDELDYGHLFAYLFRRFGYPNRGWDDYKELAYYVLNTPKSDMFLHIVPYVGNCNAITFRFYVPTSVLTTIENYGRRQIVAWQQRSKMWRENQGLPDWMPEWMQFYNTELIPAFGDAFPCATEWSDCIEFSPMGREGTREFEMTNRWAAFCSEIREGYSQFEPRPSFEKRAADFTQWLEDDPLKPYAEAATLALKDLLRPVSVRDSDINATGNVAPSSRSVHRSKVAGYPSGAIGNEAPKEFAKLHGLIMDLGKGNAKRGVEKIMTLLQQ